MKRAPRFVEIKMDAEISSYQEDFDPVRDPNFSRERPREVKVREKGTRGQS